MLGLAAAHEKGILHRDLKGNVYKIAIAYAVFA